MSAQNVSEWQGMLATLAKELGIAEPDLLNEAVADLCEKYDNKKKSIAHRTALVVEDSAMMRMILEDMLTHAGITITGRAENGYEAVKLFNGNESFDYVFLNVAMPALDGIEALSDFKDNHDSRIIMVTSTKRSDLLLKSVKNGAHQVLYRPFCYGNLLKVMSSSHMFSKDKYDVLAARLAMEGKTENADLSQTDVFKLAAMPGLAKN